MSRVEMNAAGKTVPVDTPEYGCIVIEVAAPEPKPKAKPVADEPAAKTEGE